MSSNLLKRLEKVEEVMNPPAPRRGQAQVGRDRFEHARHAHGQRLRGGHPRQAGHAHLAAQRLSAERRLLAGASTERGTRGVATEASEEDLSGKPSA